MAHDATNYAIAIGAYANFLNDEIDEQQVKAKKYSEAILSTSKKLNALVSFFKKYKTNCRGVSWQSLEQIYNYCNVSSSNIEMVPEEEMGGIKIFASDLVPKVLDNLMDNAIRHGNATQIKLSRFFSNEDLVIVCEDNGIGVPKENKIRIFEKGFGGNTGMGLYLAREILNITNIKISETGEPGKGARFEMVIPKDYYKL